MSKLIPLDGCNYKKCSSYFQTPCVKKTAISTAAIVAIALIAIGLLGHLGILPMHAIVSYSLIGVGTTILIAAVVLKVKNKNASITNSVTDIDKYVDPQLQSVETIIKRFDEIANNSISIFPKQIPSFMISKLGGSDANYRVDFYDSNGNGCGYLTFRIQADSGSQKVEYACNDNVYDDFNQMVFAQGFKGYYKLLHAKN